MNNFLIVHYNTPKLTEALIKNLYKIVNCDFTIYLFDNSNDKPFVNYNKYDKIKYIDNTKSQFIDFNKFLEQYPDRFKSKEATHTFGSAKHCYTVEYFLNNFEENFILLDSDIILINDVSQLFNDNYLYIGEISKPHWTNTLRLLPYLCFINNKMCKKLGIHYFNDNYMTGLMKGDENSSTYDTGANFLRECSNYENKVLNIDIHKYMVHFGAGSWQKENTNKKDENDFLNKFSKYID